MLNLEIQMLDSFAKEQQKDSYLKEIIEFLEMEQLPYNQNRARKIAIQASLFAIDEQFLDYIDPKQKHQKRMVVASHKRNGRTLLGT